MVYPWARIVSCGCVSSWIVISKGSPGAMVRSASTTRLVPLGPMIRRGCLLSAFPMESKSPGRPLTWSPCTWVIQIKSISCMLQPCWRILTWVPSPQSISRLLPLNLVINAVNARLGNGIIPLVPSRHTSSKTLTSSSFV